VREVREVVVKNIQVREVREVMVKNIQVREVVVKNIQVREVVVKNSIIDYMKSGVSVHRMLVISYPLK
jgi:hypothetical protein